MKVLWARKKGNTKVPVPKWQENHFLLCHWFHTGVSKETAKAGPRRRRRRRDTFHLGEEEQPMASILPPQFHPGGNGFWTMEVNVNYLFWQTSIQSRDMSLGSCSQGALYITTQKVPVTKKRSCLDFESCYIYGLFSWAAAVPLETVSVPGEGRNYIKQWMNK